MDLGEIEKETRYEPIQEPVPTKEPEKKPVGPIPTEEPIPA